MKKYDLVCPHCHEPEVVHLPAHAPNEPHCTECGEDVDLDEVHTFINGWTDYLADRKAFLEAKK